MATLSNCSVEAVATTGRPTAKKSDGRHGAGGFDPFAPVSNDARARRADAALQTHRQKSRCPAGDGALRRLLIDLRHWYDRQPLTLSWEEAVRLASLTYEEERAASPDTIA